MAALADPPHAARRDRSRSLQSNRHLSRGVVTLKNTATDAPGAPDEGALVERAQRGDSAAFGELYQRHVERVYSYIVFRVQDTETAQDLTSEVFLSALRAVASFTYRGAVSPWLMSIARNAVVDHWRRRGRRPEEPLSSFEVDLEEEEEGLVERLALRTEYLAPDDRAELVLTRERIAGAATHLTDLQQQVLALRFSAGMSVKESAQAMGRSEGAVKNLQHHALRALKKHLGQ
jgi:RNA polymerase sigma-70 factor (ECF subfamily)